MLSLQFLSRSGVRGSIGWQSLECVSHLPADRSGYRHFFRTQRSRWVPCIRSDNFDLIRYNTCRTLIERLVIPLGLKRQRYRALDILFPKSLDLLFLPCLLLIIWFPDLSRFSHSCCVKKGEKSDTVGGAGKGKAAVEEKGKRASHRTRIRMNFDTKTSKLNNQEAADRYLASYDLRSNLGIKIEFCPHSVDSPA